MIFDAKGNLYGTTTEGGADAVGSVFQLTPTKGDWTMHVIHTFTGGTDGGDPTFGGLVINRAGNLYGETFYGGLYGYGVAYKLAKSAHGKWTQTVLHSFTNGRDGAYPAGGLIFGSSGNLCGTTNWGGAKGYGVVYEVIP